MAARSNTTRAHRRAISRASVDTLLRYAAGEADTKIEVVDLLARVIRDKMQEIHGGDFQIRINHAVGYVTIKSSGRSEIAPSDLREAI